MASSKFKQDKQQHDLVDSVVAFSFSFGFILLLGIVFTLIEAFSG